MSNDATTVLDQIITFGNRPSLRSPSGDYKSGGNLIRCVDGFQVSVIAGAGCYCTPRPDWPFEGGATAGYPGPYTKVEVGYPTERPEPWESWAKRAEDADSPTETVYSFVPVELVRALVAAHGGEA